jgi:hypothetical protein
MRDLQHLLRNRVDINCPTVTCQFVYSSRLMLRDDRARSMTSAWCLQTWLQQLRTYNRIAYIQPSNYYVVAYGRSKELPAKRQVMTYEIYELKYLIPRSKDKATGIDDHIVPLTNMQTAFWVPFIPLPENRAMHKLGKLALFHL